MHVALRNKLNITGSTDVLDPKTQLETEKAVSGDLLARAPSSGSGQWGSSAHLAFSIKMPTLGLMTCFRRTAHSTAFLHH